MGGCGGRGCGLGGHWPSSKLVRSLSDFGSRINFLQQLPRRVRDPGLDGSNRLFPAIQVEGCSRCVVLGQVEFGFERSDCARFGTAVVCNHVGVGGVAEPVLLSDGHRRFLVQLVSSIVFRLEPAHHKVFVAAVLWLGLLFSFKDGVVPVRKGNEKKRINGGKEKKKGGREMMCNQERRYAVKKEERGREGKCSVQFQKRWKLSYPLFLEKEKEKAREKKKKRKREIENQNRDAFWDPKSTARVNQLNKQPIHLFRTFWLHRQSSLGAPVQSIVGPVRLRNRTTSQHCR